MPRDPRRVIRVLTEGEITEPNYLIKWARLNRSVRLEITDSGMTPETLVRRAKQYILRNRRLKRSEREFDELWCVFDVDQHPNLSHAINDAQQSGIEVAVSNPCFELWLVLHREEQTAYIERHDVQRRSDDFNSPTTNGFCPPQSVSSSMPLIQQSSAPWRLTDDTLAIGHQRGRTPALTYGVSSIGCGPDCDNRPAGSRSDRPAPARST